MTMGTSLTKPCLLKLVVAACALFLTGGVAMAQSGITLTAAPTTTMLPDGQVVPMWGYSCGATSDGQATPSRVSCTAANGVAQSGGWQPPLIRVPAGQALNITLVNNLSFPTGSGTNTVPTSLMIVGQLGGGLGDITQRTTMPSPVHAPQGTTWPGTAGSADPAATTLRPDAVSVVNGGSAYSVGNNVTINSGGGSGAVASVTAVDSLGSITAVTVTAGGSGYQFPPRASITGGDGKAQFSVSLPLQALDSPTFVPPAQADRVRSFGTEVNVADAGGKVLTWNSLRPGTYLIESGTQPSIQGPMGLYGVLVVTEPDDPPAHQAYGTKYDQDVALLFSEIDQVQNAAVDQAVRTAGFSDALVWNGQAGQCGDATVHTCYPPAVNYTPLYYLINGLSFDRTAAAASTQALATAGVQGNVLLRLVNAGLRMHVPSVVGSKLTLLAEDGNKLPGTGSARQQSEVLLTAGKTYDVTIQPTQSAPATSPATYADATYPVYDRALNLSTGNVRDGGMQAYLLVGAGSTASGGGASGSATTLSAANKTYYCVAGSTLAVTDPTKGVLAGATGANGAVLVLPVSLGASDRLNFSSNGTFIYTSPVNATTCGGSFQFKVNGTQAQTATITQCDARTQGSTDCSLGGAPTVTDLQFFSPIASRYVSAPPGVLAGVTANPSGQALTAVGAGLNADGSFIASPSATACSAAILTAYPGATCTTLSYQAKTAQGVASNTANATVVFQKASNLAVNVKDAKNGVAVTDYRWIIEEDRTVWLEPKCQINSKPISQGGKRPDDCAPLPVESLGYSFHTAHMPVVAQGCVGTTSCEVGQTLGGAAAVCDVGNGTCRIDATQKAPLLPGDVHLDPKKRYFISVLPGDGVNPTIGGAGGPDENGKPFSIAKTCGAYDPVANAWVPGGTKSMCGHEMGGAQIAAGQTAVNIALQQSPQPTAKIAVFVFQDDNPLNGENDAGGGVDVIAPNEAGLAGFEIKVFDQAGGLGDNTGQVTYDQFNQPLSNALAGKIDPITGLDSCPITRRNDGRTGNFVGMIPTCPKYESDGKTQSPLAGQAIIANLFPGLYEIQAYPAADRIANGEEWLQTNTLDGGKPHEAFIKPNEPGYFQEFGPGGFHVAIGFANPKIINARKTAAFCAGLGGCTSNLTVHVSNNHMSRTPDQRTYSSGTYDHYSFTQCYVSIGAADAQDFQLEKCDPNGNAVFNNIPAGTYKISVFDQWNDIMLDGLVGTVSVGAGNNVKNFPVTQWRTNLYTRTFIDTDGSGVSTEDKPGLALVNTNIRYRDGSVGFFNNTDLNGYAGFNEVFPFMNWLVVETSTTRYKATGAHTVYDAGGPVDCADPSTYGNDASNAPPCSGIAAFIANTKERVPLPADLRVPGGRYCAGADCPAGDIAGGSTGAVMPVQAWGNNTIAWQGLLGQNTFIEFGVRSFKENENGGIAGDVIYASTRPFDDPALSLQLSWEPGVPNVKVNLYSKGVDAQGNPTLTLVDTTTTTSFDDWAQGFRRDAAGALMQKLDGSYIPNMNCPGQDSTSPFFATLKNSKQWLDTADASNNRKPLAYNSQFKCYDGWSQLNQAQPAPYDGRYKFPSVTAVYDKDTTVNGVLRKAGTPSMSNCSGCSMTDADGNPMLPPGNYVVEVIVPTGYELVKEEDKNILLGDVFIAPVTQQFAGFGNIFIMPDQAAVNAHYNANNPGGLDLTNNQGSVTFPRHEGDTGSIETFWSCVGASRIVPDLNSLFPGAGQAAPFAGAKRNLCDRKEVVLQDEGAVLAKFFLFSSTHIAGHFTGLMTNDFASEFDPFSPQFGEKFGPPNLPVGMRDFNGNEVARVYADQWGVYNGLYFSSWTVNPPNPTGYAPQMSIACMNDPGPITDTRAGSPTLGQMITDPSYSPAYSNFCYEMPFMPGFTAYMDTPVIPTQAFADGYNLPDSEYPDGTPAIRTATGAVAGPWVTPSTGGSSASATFTISGVKHCQSPNCSNPTTITFPGGTVTCDSNSNPGPDCSGGANSRANNVASYIRSNIAALMGSGYTASGSGANVTVSATAHGASTATVISGKTNLSGPNVPVQLAGGSADTGGSMNLTITALGDKVVINPNYSGPNSTADGFNNKTITRHYGFGARPANCPSSGNCLGATIGGVAMTNVGTWNDTTIVGTVPMLPLCSASSPAYKGANATARCGQLVITAANGKQSIDTVTVTVGGSAPWLVTPGTDVSAITAPSGKTVKDYTANFGRMEFSPIQTAIDSASPGDLIIVAPGTYRENLIMWKPVRLQGVGAAAVTVNADAHPAGKMDQWRRQVNCAFGLTLDGTTNLGNTNYSGTDPNNNDYSCPVAMHQRVDRIPFEAIVGWDASGNGNLAQVLQEPTLMGAYEGAGITVLGRGVRIPDGNTDFWGTNATGGAGAFTDGSVYLGSGTNDCAASITQVNGSDYGTSNFQCNPARIDGLSIINSSQGGGALFIHGWAHFLDVGNTRISGNHGTLAGAINLGNGETPNAFINDGTECGVNPPGTPCPPFGSGSGNNSFGGRSLLPPGVPGYQPVLNSAIPFQFNVGVRIHNSMIYNNAGIGDALFSGTPAGSGAITVSAGADNYRIDHNWIAGNMSTGDGGGVQHLGLSFNGSIDHNYILFNQTSNPTLPTNGGGLIIEGANLDRQLNGMECGSTTDQDCPPGLGEGAGPGTVVDANLILGNSAESGSGGGLRIQQVNGSEVVAFPTSPDPKTSGSSQSPGWYDVTVTNNIIANNVAGWDGGGVSIQDAFKVSFVNNTVASNDTTASAGSLFKTLGAIVAASPPPGCNPQPDPTLPQDPSCTGADAPHGPQPAGLVTMYHTPNLIQALPLGNNSVSCPSGYGYTNGNNGDCRLLSKPKMMNNLFWQNRTFSVNIIGTGTGNQSQQNLVALTPQLTQTATGACAEGAKFWDIGLRTDDYGNVIPTGTKLTVTYSVYTADTQGVISTTGTPHNTVGGATPVVAQYCNGARVPPENCAAEAGQTFQASCTGYNTPVGASETTSLTQFFAFNGIQPTATVDEGHNWLNLVYGPLTLSRPNVNTATSAEMMIAGGTYGTVLGAYSIPSDSTAVSHGTTSGVPATAAYDYFGNARSGHNDAGAVQFTSGSSGSVRPSAVAFGNVRVNLSGAAVPTQTLTVTAGSAALTGGIHVLVSGTGFSRVTGNGNAGGTCGNGNGNVNAGNTCTVIVQFAPTAQGPATGTVAITSSATIIGAPVALTGTGTKIDLAVTPTPLLQYGDAFVGTTTPTQTVTLKNQSSGPAVVVTGIGFAISGPFARTGGSCSQAAFTLAAGASCTIDIVFKPTAINPVAGALKVTADTGFAIDGGTLQLSGNGLMPAVTPATLSFGDVVQTTPAIQTLTLSNATNVNSNSLAFPSTGNMSVVVSGSGFARPSGSAGGTCGNSVAAGATCTIVIGFTPASTNAVSGTVTISGNGGLTVLPAVQLTGKGVAATFKATVSPNPLAFGNQLRNTSATKSLMLTNTGNAGLSGLGYTLGNGGTNSTTFTHSNGSSGDTCGNTLAAGASCTYVVQFSPVNSTGSVQRTLTITGNNVVMITGSPATMTGNGVAAAVSFTSANGAATLNGGGTTLDFGNDSTPVTSTVTVKVGSAPVSFGAASVSSSNATTGFTKGADTCSGNTKSAGATCTIAINFNAPGGNSSRTGTLTVIDSAGSLIVVPLNITGR